jgi:hypothetical protein
MSAQTRLCPHGRRGVSARTRLYLRGRVPIRTDAHLCPRGHADVHADASVLSLDNFITNAIVRPSHGRPSSHRPSVCPFVRPSVRLSVRPSAIVRVTTLVPTSHTSTNNSVGSTRMQLQLQNLKLDTLPFEHGGSSPGPHPRRD